MSFRIQARRETHPWLELQQEVIATKPCSTRRRLRSMAIFQVQMSACSVLDIEPFDFAPCFTEDGEQSAKTASQEFSFHSCLELSPASLQLPVADVQEDTCTAKTP